MIIHDLLLVELLDVEYYRDLEMWVRGHSRSFKLVPFESFSAVSYSVLNNDVNLKTRLGWFKVTENSAVAIVR